MRMADADGVRFVQLEISTYQFAQTRGDVHDDNWLVINGKARSDIEQWSFQDPCLLAWEAQDLGAWLRSVTDGRAEVMTADDEGYLWPNTDHMEPNLGFGLVAYEADFVTIRSFLRLESGPPSIGLKEDRMDWSMDLNVTRDDLRSAVEEWDAALEKFPAREIGHS